MKLRLPAAISALSLAVYVFYRSEDSLQWMFALLNLPPLFNPGSFIVNDIKNSKTTTV